MTGIGRVRTSGHSNDRLASARESSVAERHYLFCLRALEVGADRERARIILLHIGHGCIEIEIADMAQDEPLRIRTLCHGSDHSGERLVWIVGAYADGEMHEQNVGAFGEAGKSWIGTVLV